MGGVSLMPPKIRSVGGKQRPSDFDSSDVDATAALADHEQPPSPSKPWERGPLTDLELLPRRFDLFVGEVRDSLASIGTQLLPLVNRVEAALSRLEEREKVRDAHVLELAHVSAEHTRQIERIEQRLGLEPLPLPPLSSLPRRAKRNTLKR
jgi:hypothetical protein